MEKIKKTETRLEGAGPQILSKKEMLRKIQRQAAAFYRRCGKEMRRVGLDTRP